MEIDLEDLKESNDFLNALYSNVTSGIFLADGEARIHNFNDAFKALFYKREDQLLHQLCGNAMGCQFHEEQGLDCGETPDCESCILRCSILKSFTERVPVYKERLDRVFYIDGRKIEKHFIFTTKYINHRGTSLILVIFDDITELEEYRKELLRRNEYLSSFIQKQIRELGDVKEALTEMGKEKDVLIGEVHHRVGNSLQIISSLLSMQMQNSGESIPKEDIEATNGRVIAIRTLYDILFSKGLQNRINLGEYLEAILDCLEGEESPIGAGVHFRRSIADFTVSLDTAIPVGLIVNEIVNEKALSDNSGRKDGVKEMDIIFQKENLYRLTVSYREDGEEGDVLSSFGRSLIQVLTSQIRGTVEESVSEGGSSFVLTFP